MRADAEQYYAGLTGIGWALFGLLSGPLAFLLHQAAVYWLVTVECPGGVLARILAALATLALAAGGAWVARRTWQDTGREMPGPDDRVETRTRFLAVGGLLLNALFSLAIVAQAIPGLMVTCPA